MGGFRGLAPCVERRFSDSERARTQRLSRGEAAALAGAMEARDVGRGEALLRQGGSLGAEVLCIFSGRASAWWADPASGARRKVASLRERACVGDAALACCPPAAVGYNAEVRADTPLHVLAFPRAALPPARAEAPAEQPHSVLLPEPGSLPEAAGAAGDGSREGVVAWRWRGGAREGAGGGAGGAVLCQGPAQQLLDAARPPRARAPRRRARAPRRRPRWGGYV